MGRHGAFGASVALVVALTACGPEVPPGAPEAPLDLCEWPMWGHDATRSFGYPCPSPISPDTVGQLEQAWFFGTDDAVTATPAVVGGTAYVGDWSGRFYAIDVETGRLVWSFTAEPHPSVYAGQIVSSAAVANVSGEPTVYFGAGKTLYALRAADGSLRWARELGRRADDADPTEIESSPVISDGVVIVGTDVHNSLAGEPAGVYAFDAATGAPRWRHVTAPAPGAEPTGSGCGDVWGSPTVDPGRRLVFVGTGNCISDEGWGANTEALLALDLDSGERVWSYQPHRPNHDDLDFAGAPNLFEVDGRAAVGLGNKDGAYYAVDRDTGEPLWQRKVAEPGIPEPGSDFSTGGFIGPTAVAEGVVVGGTAVGGDPYVHALDTRTGEIVWQQPVAGPTYAASLVVNGVVFLGGVDYTLRAFDLRSGEVLWEQGLSGAVSGGAVVVGGDLLAVAGMREPGVGEPLRTAGVYRFRLAMGGGRDRGSTETAQPPSSPSTTPGVQAHSTDEATTTTTTPTSTASPDDPEVVGQPCIAAPCELSFDLTGERVGGETGSGTLYVGLAPFRVEVETDGLGDPARWLRPGSAAAGQGATAYAVYLSEGTDNPVGGLVCVLDAAGDCSADENPAPGTTYDRISILAVRDPAELPTITEGFDRLVTTNAFEIPFAPAD